MSQLRDGIFFVNNSDTKEAQKCCGVSNEKGKIITKFCIKMSVVTTGGM